MKTIRNLFLEELAVRLHSEKQLVAAIPSMIEASTSTRLRNILQGHFLETQDHIDLLEKLFKELDEKPRAKKCYGTVGLLRDCEDRIATFKGTAAINAAIIAAAQKIEHYEVASYGCLQEWATVLNRKDIARTLKGILDQEKSANNDLIDLARSHINTEALGNFSEDTARSRLDSECVTQPVIEQSL